MLGKKDNLSSNPMNLLRKLDIVMSVLITPHTGEVHATEIGRSQGLSVCQPVSKFSERLQKNNGVSAPMASVLVYI